MNMHGICALLARTVALAGALTIAACLDVPGRTSCGGGLGCPVNLQCATATIDKKRVAVCIQPGACGNRIREGREECDDGDIGSGDGCSDICQLEGCGNGRLDFGEECDCGTGSAPFKDPACRERQNSMLDGYCDTECKLHCGDGDIAGEEVCDPNASLTESCTSLLYDFGELACSASCDAFITDDCGVWNWQIMNTPTLATLYGAWGSSPYNVFAVGEGGTVMRYNGLYWASMETPTEATLKAVWGSDPANVFAVGEGGTVMRYDGQSWALVPLPAEVDVDVGLNGVWGRSAKDVFVVGDDGAVMRYDGQTWTSRETLTDAALHGIWGGGSRNVFAVDGNGAVMHYDGQSWVEQSRLMEGALGAVWGSSANDVFVVGEEIMHYDGQSWRPVASPAYHGYDRLSGVWGYGPEDVFAIGSGGTVIHYDRTAAVLMETPTDVELRGIWGSDSDDVFIVGDHGVVVHYSGQSKVGM